MEDFLIKLGIGFPSLPSGYLPKKFELMNSTYGHPLANQSFEKFDTGVLRSIGFKPYLSTPSVHTLERDGKKLIFDTIADNFVMSCKYGCPLKQYVIGELMKVYLLTRKDPLKKFYRPAKRSQ